METDTTCGVDGCETKVDCRGLCKRHYGMWYRDHRNGKPNPRHAEVVEPKKKGGGHNRKDLSDVKESIIRLRVEEGWSTTQLADEFGVSCPKTIIKRLKKWGVYESFNDVGISEHKQEIIRLRAEEGWSTTQLAEEFNVANQTIIRRLKNWGVYESLNPSASRDLSDVKDEIIRLRTVEGWSCPQLAEEFDVSRSTIIRRLEAWGVYESMVCAEGIDLSPQKSYILRLRKDEGYNIHQLSDEIGVSTMVLIKNLKAWGVYESRMSDGWNAPLDLDNEEIIRLRVEEGYSVPRLADEFDVSPSTIINRLKKSGVFKPFDCDYINHTTYVYLMETPTSNLNYSKIGISNKPMQRRKRIDRMGTGKLDWEVKDTFEFDTRSEAYAMEQALHEANEAHRVAGEFFRVPVDELDLEPLREERIIQDRTVQEEFEIAGLPEPEPVLELAA